MAARLKRRSSIGFNSLGGRRDSGGGVPEPQTPTPFTQATEDDEAAERKARNLQRKQAQNLETAAGDSPGLERQGSSGRRSIGGISGLSAAQLAEHYNNCIKLSAENKISAKNAFNLQLIDYMATMIKKKESDMNNFQVAAGTLDASTKIYAYRVDSVYGDTLKIASGLGQAGKQDDGDVEGGVGEGAAGEEGDPNNPDQPKKKRRIKKSATVEKNLKNINVSKFELEFDVDPLFKKTSSQFDGGSGGNQFLATLLVRDEGCELLLDSDTVMETVNTGLTPQKEGLGGGTTDIPPLDTGLDSLAVCPTFSAFSFIKWNLDKEGEAMDDEYNRLNESISASQEERAAGHSHGMENEENAFDAFAVPEPIDDYGDGMADQDTGGDDMDRSEWSERALGHAAVEGGARPGFTASLPMTTADMLSVLTTAPLEYSYFDHGKLGAWAGPKHWKFKPMSKVVVEGEKGKGRKKKVVEQLDYDMYDGKEEKEELQNMLEKLGLMLTVPKKSVKLVDKTMKGWNRERSTLPEDLHYSGHELVRLKTVDKMVVQAVKRVPETEVDDVADYDYDNAADNEGYCPDIDDEQDAYGDAVDDPAQPIHGSSLLGGDQEVPDSQALAGDDFAGDNLVAAPKMVDKAALQIGYAKTAKKVDMKRIKNVAWSILTQASTEEKENQGGSPEKQVDKEVVDPNNRDKEIEETQFSVLYRTLKQPTRLPKTMSDNLSVPLAFIALLHLCNEESLHLIPSENMEDFKIVKG
eukprot:GFUD01007533.1.p1 GENE.GFUD01007533.1~~GFUD01007533.1.p1  ORF type:complete len:751 (+),score=265.35 GFUD01007533.1:57-2309(+)